MRRLAVMLPLVVASACRLGSVEPLPLSGEAPAAIAVWPVVQGPQSSSAVWLTGLAAAVGRRGYRVLAPAVAGQMLLDAGVPIDTRDANVLGRVLQADALLELWVRQFEAAGERSLQSARWDLEWRLVSTRGAGVQWSFTHHGNWRQADRDPLGQLPDLDQPEQPGDIVPIGGNRMPGFRDAGDLFAWLHRFAMERLPVRGTQ